MDPSGSKVAPGKVGNTEQPSLERDPKLPRGNAKKTWIITLSGQWCTNMSVTDWIKEHCTCAVWQIEKGEESGYVHFQITMTLKVKQRLSWLKNHFARHAHCEIANNIDKSFDYCQKSETRIGGPYYWPEAIMPVKDPLANVEYYDWQQEIIEMLHEPADDRTIMWYWSEMGNVGKSHFAKHLALTRDGVQVCRGKKADIYMALQQGLKVLIIDIPRNECEFMGSVYTVIEEVKNGLVFSGKYKSKTKIFDPPHVLVFSNVEPDVSKLSEDRWHIRNID